MTFPFSTSWIRLFRQTISVLSQRKYNEVYGSISLRPYLSKNFGIKNLDVRSELFILLVRVTINKSFNHNILHSNLVEWVSGLDSQWEPNVSFYDLTLKEPFLCLTLFRLLPLERLKDTRRYSLGRPDFLRLTHCWHKHYT